jgi:hypothetical protein
VPASLAVLVFVMAERRGDMPVAYYACAGLLIGVATGYKQVAVFGGATIALMIWLTHERPLRFVPLRELRGATGSVCGVLSRRWRVRPVLVRRRGLIELCWNWPRGPFVHSPVSAALLASRGSPASASPARDHASVVPGALAQVRASQLDLELVSIPHYLQGGARYALAIVANPFEMERGGGARAPASRPCS